MEEVLLRELRDLDVRYRLDEVEQFVALEVSIRYNGSVIIWIE